MKNEYIKDLISKAKSGYEWYKPIFDNMTKSYLLEMAADKLDYLMQRNKSQLYIPKINSKAKRISDALSETYFAVDKFAKLGEYINSDPKVIEKWQIAVDYFTDDVGLYKTFQPIFLKTPFLGTAVAKVFWADNGVVIEEIELGDIYFDPDAKNHRDVRYITNKIYLTKDDIKKLVKNKIFKRDILEAINDEIKFTRFELYDFYEKIGDEWQVSTIYNDSIIARESVKLRDGHPFIFGYMLPQVKKTDEDNYVCVYGEPPLSSMLPLQDEMNTLRNAFIDGVNALLKPKIIVDKNAHISKLDIETPGKPIYASNPAGINVLPMPNLAPASGAIQLLDNEMSEVSGVSPQQNGISSNRKETATMANIMASEGSVRIQGYIRTFNETFFEPIFERVAMLVWKYADPMFFAGYSRKELPSYKVDINTGIGALNKETQKQSLIELSGMIAGHFQMCMAGQDIEGAKKMLNANLELIRKVFPLYGEKNVDEILGVKSEFARTIELGGGVDPNQGEQGGQPNMGQPLVPDMLGMGNEQIPEPNVPMQQPLLV